MFSRLNYLICTGNKLIHCLLILAIGIALYANTLKVPFLFDDLPCIVNNKAIATYFDTSMSLAEKQAHLLPDAVNSMDARRLVYFTFALNHLVHGLDVTGYHIVNLLIHLATSLAVYALIATLLQTTFFSTHSVPQSWRCVVPFIGALLFVSHPIQTSAVTYIAQRFTSLATLFYLLAITLYLKARMSDSTKRQLVLLAVSVGIAVLGMFTKEIVFTVPVTAIVCEILFLRGTMGKRMMFLLPLLGTMLIIPLNMLSQIDVTGGIKEVLDDSVNLANLDNVSQKSYFLTQLRVMVTYFRLLLLPVNQHLDYDYPRYHSLFDLPVALSALLLLGIILSAVWAYRRSQTSSFFAWQLRLYSFGVAWFFITISMSSSIIPLSDMIFEYRLYLPSTGFFIAGTVIGILVCQKLAQSGFWIVKIIPAVAVVMVVSLCIATVSRNYEWGDPIRFWEDNVQKAPLKRRPREQLVMRYYQAGNLKEHINQALILVTMLPADVDNYKLWNDIAVNLAKLARFDEALVAVENGIALRPDDQRLHMTRDWVLLQTAQSEKIRLKE